MVGTFPLQHLCSKKRLRTFSAHPNHGVTHSVCWELHGWCSHSLCLQRDPRDLPE